MDSVDTTVSAHRTPKQPAKRSQHFQTTHNGSFGRLSLDTSFGHEGQQGDLEGCTCRRTGDDHEQFCRFADTSARAAPENWQVVLDFLAERADARGREQDIETRYGSVATQSLPPKYSIAGRSIASYA